MSGYQFVWWWRWQSVWPPIRLRRVPYPTHGPNRGRIYEWMGLRLGPLEIRKWAR